MSNVLDAHDKVERLARQLAEARAEFRAAVKEARKEGESVSELARRLGISRTRVQQYLRD